jgi:hypothetical protein
VRDEFDLIASDKWIAPSGANHISFVLSEIEMKQQLNYN